MTATYSTISFRKIVLSVLLFGLFSIPSSCFASLVVFEVTGSASVAINNVSMSPVDYIVTFSVDDAELDMLPDNPNRGAFANVTTTLTFLDPTLGIQDEIALNINGVRQESNAIFLANDNNFFNQGFSIGLPAGALSDPNVIAPLNFSDVTGSWSGAGLQWNLANGDRVRFNQVFSITVNSSAVPEPGTMFCLLLGLVCVPTFVRKSKRAA